MNLSSDAVEDVRSRDGEPAEDRAAYSDEIQLRRRVGWATGSPVIGETVGLNADLEDVYAERYSTYTQLLRPDAGEDLRRLFDTPEITSLEDGAAELGMGRQEDLLEKALELHGVEYEDPEAGEDAADGPEALELPSGEEWGLELLETPAWGDSRVLTTLMATAGLGTGETARFLSDRLETDVSEADIRQRAKEIGLLE